MFNAEKVKAGNLQSFTNDDHSLEVEWRKAASGDMVFAVWFNGTITKMTKSSASAKREVARLCEKYGLEEVHDDQEEITEEVFSNYSVGDLVQTPQGWVGMVAAIDNDPENKPLVVISEGFKMPGTSTPGVANIGHYHYSQVDPHAQKYTVLLVAYSGRMKKGEDVLEIAATNTAEAISKAKAFTKLKLRGEELVAYYKTNYHYWQQYKGNF